MTAQDLADNLGITKRCRETDQETPRTPSTVCSVMTVPIAVLRMVSIQRYCHSANTRNKFWGSGMMRMISQRLRQELPGLRGFSETNLKNMRSFYEAWNSIEVNSSVTTDEINKTLVEKKYRYI